MELTVLPKVRPKHHSRELNQRPADYYSPTPNQLSYFVPNMMQMCLFHKLAILPNLFQNEAAYCTP